ncbi:MAG TPA: HlyD family secretion protein [Tepidisphaeraceae bacterium]|nr:HlyD family secretion protein [Tepidisphaeraceae bacterium]
MSERNDDDANGNGAHTATSDAPPARRTGEPAREPRRDAPRDDEHDREGRARRPWYRRPVPLLVLAVVIVAAAVGGVLWWLHARQWEETDDAFIAADVAPVTTKVAGMVLRVHIQLNQDVQAGDVLVDIDPRDIQARLDQSKAEVAVAQAARETAQASSASAEADVAAAQAEFERRSSDIKRYQALDPRVVSQQQLDVARAAAQSAEAQLRASQTHLAGAKAAITEAQARIEQAQAATREAELQLSYTTVRAAIAGRVTQKNVQVGQYLQVGQALMALVPRDVYIIANYKETQITNMRRGQEAEIDVDAYPDHTFHGHVDSIQSGSGAAFSLLPPENATGNYVKVVQRVPVKITFDDTASDAYKRLGPGMSVTPSVKVR